MSLNYEHECNNCGYTPKHEECYCRDCKEEAEKEAYEEGKKDGQKEAN